MTNETVLDGEGKTTMTPYQDGKERVKQKNPKEWFDAPPLLDAVLTYISFVIFLILGHLADFLRRIGIKWDRKYINPIENVS